MPTPSRRPIFLQEFTMHTPVGEYSRPPGIFDPKQVDLINRSVDIQPIFGLHGTRLDPNGHSRYLYTTDGDYVTALASVENLNPDKDAVASEQFGWSEPAATCLPTRLEEMRSRHAELRPLHDGIEMLEAARELRLISPFDYALGHAYVRGVPIHYADMPLDMMLHFRTGLAMRFPNILLREFRERAYRLRERDFLAVQAVGDIALGLAGRDLADRSILRVLRGKAHQRQFEAILDMNGISYSSQTYGHSFAEKWRLKREAWKAVTGEFLDRSFRR